MKPKYLIQVTLEASHQADKAKLQDAISELTSRDRALSFVPDDESGCFVLRGPDEMALDLAIHVLKTHNEFEIRIGAPKIAYRETFLREAIADFSHKQLRHGIGEFARVKIRLVPIDLNEPWQFEFVPDLELRPEFIRAVERGVMSVTEAGPYAGFPLQGVKSILIDGAWHPVDSSEKAFEIAARAAIREAASDAECTLLEPVMHVEIEAPARYGEDIVADIGARRGSILLRRFVGEAIKIEASVPLSNSFKYEDNLRMLTLGQSSFEMEFSHYAVFPPRDDPPPEAAAAALVG
jgi:elongation factor G